MSQKETQKPLNPLIQKLLGGIEMTWVKVILLAVVSAVITSFFLIVPSFRNTSFERMGVHFEAWIFLAVIIMANCKKPLESSFKTFVFFLISQPLIYLIQVPFSSLGWGLFGYYRYWLIWTFLTLPMAYIGWYIRKRNWLSLLILSPVLGYLLYVSIDSFRFTLAHFPYMLITALFCLAQVLIYLYTFTENQWQKLAGLIIPAAIAAFLVMNTWKIDVKTARYLPDNPILSENAEVTTEDTDIAVISIYKTGENSMVMIETTKLGTTAFTIKDGENEYSYTVEIYEDSKGYTQVEITVK